MAIRWIVLAVLSLGCQQGSPPPPNTGHAQGLGECVARLAGTPIFSKQLQADSYVHAYALDKALSHFIDDEVLADLARRKGVTPPPSPQLDKTLAQRWMDLVAEPLLKKSEIPREQLQAIYTSRLDQYRHPRQAEIDVLAIYTGARMKPEARQKRRGYARELEEALRKADPQESFESIAKRPEWGGKHVTWARLFQGPDSPLPPAVGKIVLQFSKTGQTSALIEDENGYFIAKYLGERPAINIPFERVAEDLAKEIFEDWRRSRFAELTSRLLKQHAIEVASPK